MISQSSIERTKEEQEQKQKEQLSLAEYQNVYTPQLDLVIQRLMSLFLMQRAEDLGCSNIQQPESQQTYASKVIRTARRVEAGCLAQLSPRPSLPQPQQQLKQKQNGISLKSVLIKLQQRNMQQTWVDKFRVQMLISQKVLPEVRQFSKPSLKKISIQKGNSKTVKSRVNIPSQRCLEVVIQEQPIKQMPLKSIKAVKKKKTEVNESRATDRKSEKKMLGPLQVNKNVYLQESQQLNSKIKKSKQQKSCFISKRSH